jgi:hypothetical protein
MNDEDENSPDVAAAIIAGTVDDLTLEDAVGILGGELVRALSREAYPHAGEDYMDEEISRLLWDEGLEAAVDAATLRKTVH